MRGKTLNFDQPSFQRAHTPMGTLFIKTAHDGEQFYLVEAYVAIEKRIPEGDVSEHLQHFNEVMDTWYNASFRVREPNYNYGDGYDAAASYIVFDGYVSIMHDRRRAEYLAAAVEYVSTMKTKRELVGKP